MFKDYYMILQVHFFASDDIIKAAYKKLSQINHPDMGGDAQVFLSIQEAYEHLIDKKKKDGYLKKWMKFYIQEGSFEFSELKPSLYDITLFHVKNTLLDYLKLIQNKNFEDAYALISDQNKKKIFKKDFILWQKLISEIHHLLGFDCSLGDYQHTNEGLTVSYKVKVKEFNILMNHVEVDYFNRRLIYENHEWKLLLSDIDVRGIIRKYKKILIMNKKNIKKYLPKIDENHVTKYISKKYFVNNCEYEKLRYIRYGNLFSIILCSSQDEHLVNVIQTETRQLDCFCDYGKNQFLILLPETDKVSSKIVVDKFNSKLRGQFKYNIAQISDDITIKELIESVCK